MLSVNKCFMASYISIKGWLECEFEQVAAIKAQIINFSDKASKYTLTGEQAELYLSAWHFPEKPVNWTSYVFLGVDVQSYALQYIEDQILAGLIDDEIEGYFEVVSEEGESQQWRISDKGIRKSVSNKMY